MPIGIFDSGVGGLTVYSSIDRALPHSDIYYLGDTARVPYGNKSKETIVRYSLECASFLFENFKIDILVVACNTASSHAVDILKNHLSIPVIGVVEPGVEQALKVTKNGKIGVIGTYATIRSESYKKNLLEKNKDVEVYQKPCPLFVPLVEEGLLEHPVTFIMIEEYLQEIVDKGIDTLILGCTHYPLLKESIKKVYPQLEIVDSSEVIAEKLKELNPLKERGIRRVFVTDHSPAFIKLENLILSGVKVEKVELSEVCKI